ncbi:hypothetical protein ACFO4E_19535 [Nocardiopsis mangrovi]|uniref:Uncharacterized protein n=1 Tax=Nocardiopsis mangrovi TaxID=1179818 RepID=A0ABV9DYT3_9ACTN
MSTKLAIAAGADAKVVHAVLGRNAAIMTLDRYGHLFPDRRGEVAETMDAARIKATLPRETAKADRPDPCAPNVHRSGDAQPS